MQTSSFALTIKSTLAVLFAVLMALIAATPAPAQTAPPTKRVLMVFSHQADNPAQLVVENAMRSTLQKNSSVPIETYSEYLDAVRTPLDGYEKELVDQLQRKYSGKNFDLIFALNPPALKLLTINRAALFPNAPIIFLVLDQQNLKDINVGPNTTGIWGEVDYKATVDVALALHSDTKQLVVISGAGEWDNYWHSVVQQQLRPFETRIKISYLTGLTIPELQKAVANLPSQTIVLFVSSVRDRVGNTPGNLEVVRQISAASNAPVYGSSDAQVGLGIVGGRVVSFDALGLEAAQVGLRVMNGEKPEAIAPHGIPSVPIFDSRALKRWGISESKLPPGAIVRFKQVSLWENYKWTIIGLIAAVILEGLLILQLLNADRRRRQAERKTRRADRRLREIVSNVPGIVWETVIDPVTKERKTTFVSEYVRKMLGYSPEEWLAQPPGFGLRLMADEDRESAKAASEAAIATGKDTISEHRWRAKDGRLVWIESHLSPLLAHNGTPEGLRGVSLDITERKLAEQTVQKTEEKDRAILEAIPDLMFLQTRDGVYLDLHYGDPTNLIVSPDDYLGKNMREILPPELAAKFADSFERAIATGEVQRLEYELTIKGERRWYESRVVCSGENILSLVRDITERRDAELALSESERRSRLAQEAARVGTWEWNVQTGESVWSDMVWELLGLTPADKSLSVDDFLSFIHPEDRERVWAKVSEVLAKGDEYYDEFRIVRPDGRVVWLSSQGRVVRSADGTAERLIGVNIDIGRRKLAEEAARETEQKEKAILNAIPDLMFLQTRDGVYLDYHAKNEKDLLVAPEAFLGKSMWDVLPADLANSLAACFKRAEQSNEPQIIEYRLGMNGEECWYEARIVRSGENILSVVRDITERHRALDALKQSEERFGKAFRSNPQPMSITILKNGVYLDVNESFLTMSGFTREEVIGHSSLTLGVWGTPEKRADFVTELKARGALRNRETTFRTKNGAERVLLSSAELVEIADEVCILITSSDITERILAEQALAESEQRFRVMADTAPVMIWITGRDKMFTYVNQQWVNFKGTTVEQELGHGWAEGMHPDDYQVSLETYFTAFDRREEFQMEYRQRRFDGQYRWILDHGAPRISSTGEFLGYIGTALDITDRKESEEALAKAHEELVTTHEEVQRLKSQLEEENIYLQEEIRLAKNLGEMVGASDAIKYVMFKINHVAVTDSTVLITGETGTGKELVARAIHSSSARSDRALITVNCAALPATLIESELFGHEKGAFTGAAARKLGRFELADGGTIFLDEVGELPLESQVKLLRVIQEGEVHRLGGGKPIKVDVRIIAATNRNLKREIEQGTFREDLWYRLNVFPITVPPLRQRTEDIPLLVEHFVAMYANKFSKTISEITPQTMQQLRNYSWPGNIRELANVIERAVIYTQGNVLNVVDVFETRDQPASSDALKSLEQVEREYIVHVLEHTSWRIEGARGAAKLLGLNPSTLRTRMIKLGIHKNNNSKVNSH
jgi:PAS domain S-box-containing protein